MKIIELSNEKNGQNAIITVAVVLAIRRIWFLLLCSNNGLNLDTAAIFGDGVMFWCACK